MQYAIYSIKNKRKSECFITFTKSSYLIQNYVIYKYFYMNINQLLNL